VFTKEDRASASGLHKIKGNQLDRKFFEELAVSDELSDLKFELRLVSKMDRENPRRLAALGFACEVCIAVSQAAGASEADPEYNSDLLAVAHQGSRMVTQGVSDEGPQAPLRVIEIIDEMIEISRGL
jgi:hypothetical protein